MQNRFKSKVLWISVATQIIAILISLDVIDLNTSQVIENVIVSVCELCVTFGILNNPTNSEKI